MRLLEPQEVTMHGKEKKQDIKACCRKVAMV
jgi:hypothetical protein